MDFQKANNYMGLALDEAHEAFKEDEVPIGAVIISPYGEVLSFAHNTKEKELNPCHHAEILAIEQAAKKLKSWRLTDCELYVTLEPCPMCLSAIQQARLSSVYFGAYDAKGGALSLGYNLHNDDRLNHKFNVYGGYRHQECSKLLSRFFRQKRKSYKKLK